MSGPEDREGGLEELLLWQKNKTYACKGFKTTEKNCVADQSWVYYVTTGRFGQMDS